MKRLLLFSIFSLSILKAHSQKPFTRPVGVFGSEGYQIVTDSMLIHEKYLYNSVFLETKPEYQGKEASFDLFLKKNLKYPIAATKNNTQGRVFLTFIVEKSGRLTNIKIVVGIGDGCDEEALRLLKKSSRWRPGKIHNIPVRSEYSTIVKFLKSN